MLTDVEIEDLGHQHIGTCFNNEFAFARAIESAVLSKLAAGVSVEPVGTARVHKTHDPRPAYDTFYRHQMETAIAAARVQTINECADILAEYDCLNSGMGREIRALIGANHGGV